MKAVVPDGGAGGVATAYLLAGDGCPGTIVDRPEDPALETGRGNTGLGNTGLSTPSEPTPEPRRMPSRWRSSPSGAGAWASSASSASTYTRRRRVSGISIAEHNCGCQAC